MEVDIRGCPRGSYVRANQSRRAAAYKPRKILRLLHAALGTMADWRSWAWVEVRLRRRGRMERI